MMTKLEQAKDNLNKALDNLYVARKDSSTTIETLYELIDCVEYADIELKEAERIKGPR
jgi:hypothetical protein